MDQDSKRDIYDLIAELAKSADMDIDGTEFSPVLQESKRNSQFQDTVIISESKVAEVNTPSLPAKEYVPHNHSNGNGNGNGHHVQPNNNDSIQEIELMKRAALEEISQIKASLLLEIELAKSSVQQTPNINVVPSALKTESQKNAIQDLQNAKESTLIELQNAKAALLEDLEKARTIKHVSIPQPKKDLFDALSIEELNKVGIQVVAMNDVTATPMKENFAPVKALVEEESILHLQLRLLNEKFDEMRNRNVSVDIVNELKQSDDRIVAQVKQTGESIVNHLAAQSNQTQVISGNTLVKWIGIANLLLLFLMMLYFIFQKMNALSANQHTYKSVPAATSKPIIENTESNMEENVVPPAPLQKDVAPENQTQDQIQNNTTTPIANPIETKKDRKQVSTLYEKQASIKNKGNAELNLSQKNNIEKKTLVVSPNSAEKVISSSTEMAKVEVAAKTQTSPSKKVSSSQDVYFGED